MHKPFQFNQHIPKDFFWIPNDYTVRKVWYSKDSEDDEMQSSAAENNISFHIPGFSILQNCTPF